MYILMNGLYLMFLPNRIMMPILYRDILHAKFRLWQMEFQTHAAAGRVSEIVGKKAIEFDRDKRRLGMVFAAENSLKEVEKDPVTLAECDNYTAGVNAYIESLN